MNSIPVTTSDFLLVKEEGRPRAFSDPPVPPASLIGAAAVNDTNCMPLPEITIEDFTDTEVENLCTTAQNQHVGLFGFENFSRPRANTCPEDLFRKRNGRPPTPPPGTFRKGRKFQSGFTKPVMKESISFAHHKLSRLSESDDAEDLPNVVPQASVFSQRFPARPRTSLPGCLVSEYVPKPQALFCGQRCASADCTVYSAELDRLSAPTCEVTSTPPSSSSSGEKEENSDNSSSQPDHFVQQSSVQCRFAQLSSGLDSKQLKAY